MERLPQTDTADLVALRAVGWIGDTTLPAAGLFDRMNGGPDPSGAMGRLADMARAHPHLLETALDDETVGERVVALAGGSRALSNVLVRSDDPARIIGGDTREVPKDSAEIGAWTSEALASVAAADLAGHVDMPEAARRVSAIADTATRVAVEDSMAGTTTRLAVIALGKWGGRELNYASDIDLVFVHDGSEQDAVEVAVAVTEALGQPTDTGRAFRVDLRLRPEGAAGPLSRSLESYRTYWERWAETWEIQALLKARFVAGDESLGDDFLRSAERVAFPEQLGADAVRSIRAMKRRSEGLIDSGVTELKRGVGGIRDIEFAVQMLQLVHGRANADLRTPNTLMALDRLAAGGYILDEDAAVLTSSYQWLRNAEHRVQLFDLRQSHTLPESSADRERIARAMGYRDTADLSALDHFEADLSTCRLEVRSIHERLFHRPVLEALAQSKAAAMPIEAVARRLEAFGFLDTDATRRAVADLTTGLSRRSTLMRHMLPLVMEWLSLSPDPDLGLSQLRLLLAQTPDSSAIVVTLRDDPLAAERLCTVLGTSRLVGGLIDRLPPLIPLFGDDAGLAHCPERAALIDEVLGRTTVRNDPTSAIRRFHAEHVVRIAVADISGLIDEVEVGKRLSRLADATVEAALGTARRDLGFEAPMCVVAMGKWGGRELNYASDLDAIVVTGDGPNAAEASGVVERMISILGGPATGLPSLEMDLDLRPEGKKGALVRSLESFDAYYRKWAETWELQAMLRARPAAGDLAVGSRLVDTAARHGPTGSRSDSQEIRAMKARIETERIPIGEDPDFHLKLGKGGMADVEWTVQLLQMRHGAEHPDVRTPSTLDGLRVLAAMELIPSGDAALLDAAYRFCARVRNRMFLRDGRRRDSLPDDPLDANRLARSLGYDSTPRSTLREHYRRTTRRARRVVEEHFFGIDRNSG